MDTFASLRLRRRDDPLCVPASLNRDQRQTPSIVVRATTQTIAPRSIPSPSGLRLFMYAFELSKRVGGADGGGIPGDGGGLGGGLGGGGEGLGGRSGEGDSGDGDGGGFGGGAHKSSSP